MSRKMSKKKKKCLNNCFKIFAIISILIAIFFCYMLFILAMIPMKYLIIVYGCIFVLYLFLLLFVMINKIKLTIKIISVIIFLLCDIVFFIGIKYVDDTIDFVNVIDNAISQKEEYYLMTSLNSEFDSIDKLEGKKIGVYNSLNSSKASSKLSNKISYEEILFSDIVKMFDTLEDSEINAVLISSSIKNLVEHDLTDVASNLKEVYSLSIPIQKTDDIVKIVNVTNTPFNVYIAGGDAYGNIGNVTNTDVNMVITVDPISKKLLLTSIPRDYYVNLSGQGENAYDKLTHAGYYGIEESVSAVESLLDLDINYYVKVNFSTIEGVINAIGGVSVDSEYNFCTYGGPQVCYSKGINYLNGYEALMFARERHAFMNGDVQRVKNQQRVLSAIIEKVSSSTVLITDYSKILDSVSSSFATNLDSKTISRLVKMQINDMSSWNIEMQNLVGSDLYTTNTFTFPGLNLYVMEQSEDSVNSARNKIKEFINN